MYIIYAFVGGDITVVSVEDDGDDFKPTKKRFRTPVTNKRTKVHITYTHIIMHDKATLKIYRKTHFKGIHTVHICTCLYVYLYMFLE